MIYKLSKYLNRPVACLNTLLFISLLFPLVGICQKKEVEIVDYKKKYKNVILESINKAVVVSNATTYISSALKMLTIENTSDFKVYPLYQSRIIRTTTALKVLKDTATSLIIYPVPYKGKMYSIDLYDNSFGLLGNFRSSTYLKAIDYLSSSKVVGFTYFLNKEAALDNTACLYDSISKSEHYLIPNITGMLNIEDLLIRKYNGVDTYFELKHEEFRKDSLRHIAFFKLDPSKKAISFVKSSWITRTRFLTQDTLNNIKWLVQDLSSLIHFDDTARLKIFELVKSEIYSSPKPVSQDLSNDIFFLGADLSPILKSFLNSQQYQYYLDEYNIQLIRHRLYCNYFYDIMFSSGKYKTIPELSEAYEKYITNLLLQAD